MKKIAHFTLVITLFILASSSDAQEFPYYDFGIKGGLNFTSLEKQPTNISLNPIFGLTTSGYYSNSFYLNIELLYSWKQIKLDNIIAPTYSPAEELPVYEWNYRINIQAVELFLRGGFPTSNRLSILFGAGIDFNTNFKVEKDRLRLVHDVAEINYESYEYGANSEKVEPAVYFCFTLGIRYEIERLSIELSYLRFNSNDGLYDLSKVNSNINSIYLTIGYNFAWRVKK
jgi:hypothetical protein